MSIPEKNKIEIQKKIEKLGLARTTRHIFLCGGPKCCSEEIGDTVWNYLKDRIAEINTAYPGITLQRTRAKCLRICQEGPIALIYPEGVWYRCVTKDMCERIIEDHLINGKIVEEARIITRPLNL